jgi:hypothetical protein
MCPTDSWRPTFPDPEPAHWICAVAAHAGEARILSDLTLDDGRRAWAARWLELHAPREPEAEASYVYVGLAPDWTARSPDGRATAEGVTGLGWGIGFGEPPGAGRSTVAELIRAARAALAS